TGNSVSVTGLNPYTNYTVTIFEYSGSASVPNYGTLFYASSNRYTLASLPTISPTSLNATNIGVSSASLGWTNGDGTYTLTTVRQGTSNSNSPVDGEVYSASSVYGSGDPLGTTSPYSYAVYNSTGSSVIVTGLSPATDYVAAANTFNGIFGAQNYRLSLAPTDGFTTLASQPTANASNLSFRDIDDDAMTISWLNTSTAAGGGTNHLVLMSTSPVVDLPSDGVVYIANNSYGAGTAIGQSFVVYNGTGNAFRVSNLAMETQYYIRVFEFNGSVGTYNPTTNYLTSTYINGQQFSNTSHPGSAASNLTFTGLTANTVTVNWTGGGGSHKIITARPGKRQTALAFDGVNDHVVVPYSSTLQPTSEVTLECWVNRSNWAVSTGIQYFAGN
ncbi:MAG: hypothetical protein ACRC3B_11715, partial [Bacteroidia bacterium]